MSDTPRTDERESYVLYLSDYTRAHYGWKLARQLERELKECKAKLAEAEKLLKSCRTAMSIDYRDNYKKGLVTGDCAFTDWTHLIAAIDAAMKQETTS